MRAWLFDSTLNIGHCSCLDFMNLRIYLNILVNINNMIIREFLIFEIFKLPSVRLIAAKTKSLYLVQVMTENYDKVLGWYLQFCIKFPNREWSRDFCQLHPNLFHFRVKTNVWAVYSRKLIENYQYCAWYLRPVKAQNRRKNHVIEKKWAEEQKARDAA